MKKKIEKFKETMLKGKVYILPLIALGIVGILLGFAEKNHKQKFCQGIVINILDTENYQFVSKKDVEEIVTNHGTQPVADKNISTIELKNIENRLLQNSFIKDAQAYTSLGSELHITIKQRIPVVRVYNEKGDAYYLDNEGKTFPLSPTFTALVPVATASWQSNDNDSLRQVFNKRLFYVVQAITNDSFASSLCGQLIVDKHYGFSIIPRLGKMEIFLGDTSDLRNKIVKLKSFYRSSLPQAGWAAYKGINLSFKNQVIATANN